MNYKLYCNTCNKKVKVSSHNAIKYVDENGNVLHSFDCPICDNEIGAIGLYPVEKRKL
jgi:hypothetical protein